MHSNISGTSNRIPLAQSCTLKHTGRLSFLRPLVLRSFVWLILGALWLGCTSHAHALTASAVEVSPYGCSPSPLPPDYFSTAAPLTYDGSIGDTATGYTASNIAYVLWDMGSSASLGGVQAQFTNAASGATAYYSTDGNTWTSLGSLTSGTQITFSATTARYIQFVFNGNYSSSPSVTDTRVYDSSGSLVYGPGQAPPSAPTSLTATGGYSAVGLSWAAPSGSGGTYSVYRGTTAGGEGATAIASNLSATSYTDTGVTNGTAYYYTVQAVNSAGSSPASGEASATPQNTAPPAPTNLSATGGNGQVGLSWVSGGNFPVGSGSSGYNVYRGTSAGGEGATAIATGVTGTSYTDTGLTNGTAYYYVVKAQDAAGASAASNEASATPAVPPSLTASAVLYYAYYGSPGCESASYFSTAAPLVYDGAVGDTSTGYSPSVYTLCVLWDMGSSVSLGGVQAQFSNAYYGAYAYYSTDGNNWTSLNSLTSGSQQAFSAVTARYIQFVFCGGYPSVTDTRLYDGNGNLVLGPGSAPPSAPTSLTAAAGNQYVSLSWTAPSGAGITYNVYRGTTSGGESSTAVASGLSSTAYMDSGVTNGTTYYYMVKAVNAAGPSSASGEASAQPQAAAPVAPTGLTATRGNAQVALSWTAPPGSGLTYNVYRGTSAGAESATAVALGLTGTSYTNTGLTNGTTYYYTVKAANSYGSGPASGEASATPQAPPAAPTGLTATRGNMQVSLSWTASAGATSYNVYRGTSAGGEAATAIASGQTGTSYTDTGLTNGTTYYYKVSAVGSGGEGAQSSEVSATPLAPPAAPQNVVGRAGSGSASLVWTASATATSYNVKRSTNSYGPFNLITGGSVSGTSATDTGLTNGTTYYYEVSASNVAGEGSNSYPAVSVTPGSATLAAPILSAQTYSGSSYVSLNWTAVSGATQYDLYRSTTPGGEGTTPYLVNISQSYNGPPSTSYSDSGLTMGQTYYYKVVAVGPGGEGSFSNEASATAGSAQLAAPTLKGVAGSGQATLTWSAVAGATSYNLYRSDGNGYGEYGEYGYGTLYQQGLTGTSFIDTGLTDGTQYTYYVCPVSADGQGEQSNQVSLTPGSAPLAAPVLSAQTYSGSTYVFLQWSAVAGAIQYDLYRSTTPGGEGSTPYKVNVTQAYGGTPYISCSDDDLTSGVTYYYKVVAVGLGGEGALSNEASATIGVQPLAGPVLSGTTSGTQNTLHWSAVAGATSYNLYRSAPNSLDYTGYDRLYQQGLTGTSFTDTSLTSGTIYTYHVCAVNTDGQGDQSNQISLTVGSAALDAPVLSAQSYSYGSSSSISLQWSAVAGAMEYDLYRSTTPGGEGSAPYKANLGQSYGSSPSTYYSDSSVTSGQTYYYKVVAVGPGGEGSFSNEASALVGSTPLPAPTNFTATAAPNGGQSIALAWNAVPGATSYNITRNGDTDGYFNYVGPIYRQGLTGTTWTDTNVQFGPTYTYTVSAVNVNGQGTQSNTASATLIGFGVSVASTPLTLTRGLVGVVAVNVTPSGGYTGPVLLSGAGLPSGMTAGFYPPSVTLPTVQNPPWLAGLPSQSTGGSVSSNLYFAVSNQTPPGTYTVSITGTSISGDGFTNTTTLVITVN